jgi:hypothetical protein
MERKERPFSLDLFIIGFIIGLILILALMELTAVVAH